MSSQRDIAHSIYRRLLNRARKNNEDFNYTLNRYGVERFLYRLSISPYAKQFVLKGASLLFVWKGRNYRVTRDIDLLGYKTADIKNIFKDISSIVCQQDDSIHFMPESVKAENIRDNTDYGGLNVSIDAILLNAKIALRIDIGFGDVIKPEPEIISYPVLLDMPRPQLRAYNRETFIAEKFEAMVHLGIANSRLKDFYDIWLLSRFFDFSAAKLTASIENTFKRRRTEIPKGKPFIFTSEFYNDLQKQTQWKTFIRKTRAENAPAEFSAVIKEIDDFFMPLLRILNNPSQAKIVWIKGKGWRES